LGATRPAGWPAEAESRVTIVFKVIVPCFGHKGVNRIRAALWRKSQFLAASFGARANHPMCHRSQSSGNDSAALGNMPFSDIMLKDALRAFCLRGCDLAALSL